MIEDQADDAFMIASEVIEDYDRTCECATAKLTQLLNLRRSLPLPNFSMHIGRITPKTLNILSNQNNTKL